MDSPIRILHVLGGLDAGGAETFVMNLYRAIDRKKVQFDFIKHVSEEGIYENEIHSMGGIVFKCPQYKGKNHFEYCKWWNSFFVEHPEYHLIHGHVRSTASIYLHIANKYNLISIAHSHSTSNGNGISSIIKGVMQLPIRYIADYLFACSDEAGKWLFGKKSIKMPNYELIPNGIDLNKFAFDKDKRNRIREELNISKDTIVIGHVGRMTIPKNHKFLINLFKEYSYYNPNSKLLLVGDGELYSDIKDKCDSLGISDSTVFVGSKLNTEDYYNAMDAFVFPSLWEGLGIVVIEAQSNGLSCFVSDAIPKEAILSNDVKIYSLDSMNEWLDDLKKLKICERRAVQIDEMKKYDIKNISKHLQTFYLEKLKGGN